MPAEVKILVKGYTNADSVAESGQEKTCPTITLVKDGDFTMVVDPGVLESQQILIDALNKEGLTPQDIDVVFITHSHIDHYRNTGMFSNAKVLEFFGLWDENTVEEWNEQFTLNIQILRTPGHDYTGLTVFATTDDGVVAICGDVFWKEDSPKNPEDDAYASDPAKLKESRKMVLTHADWIIPGHAGIYKVDKNKAMQNNLISPEDLKEAKKIINCKKCKMQIKRQEDKCACQPYLCYHCCECDIDCDWCNCKHKK